MEKSVQTWAQEAAKNPTAGLEPWIRSDSDRLELLRWERSNFGDDFTHMALAAVAAGIISIAHQGVLLAARQQGNGPSGRIVHPPYGLREFIKLSRDHGAHFLEKPSKADPRRLEFQKTVLNYDQVANATNINHSLALLQKLSWNSYTDIQNDLMDLFDPTGKWKQATKI